MRALVLGASGMAGHVIALYLRENGYEVDTLSADTKLDDSTQLMDVTDWSTFQVFLDSNPYDAVINCIALLVKPSEEHKDLAVLLNAYLPHFLERHYENSKTKVIHLSSDGVFSNKKSSYKEDDEYDGQGFYDRSKALGEIKNDKDLTIRMSVIGPVFQKNGSGLFDWFYQQTGEISGFDKVVWSGITTIELAKAIKAAIDQHITGVYHLAYKTGISKFDLLQLCREVFGRDDIIIKPDSSVIFERILANTRSDFNYTVPDYKTMVKEMKAWMGAHKDIYQRYTK